MVNNLSFFLTVFSSVYFVMSLMRIRCSWGDSNRNWKHNERDRECRVWKTKKHSLGWYIKLALLCVVTSTICTARFVVACKGTSSISQCKHILFSLFTFLSSSHHLFSIYLSFVTFLSVWCSFCYRTISHCVCTFRLWVSVSLFLCMYDMCVYVFE